MKAQFSGASGDDAASHLNNFVELYDMQKYKEVEGDIIKLKLFHFFLVSFPFVCFKTRKKNSSK